MAPSPVPLRGLSCSCAYTSHATSSYRPPVALACSCRASGEASGSPGQASSSRASKLPGASAASSAASRRAKKDNPWALIRKASGRWMSRLGFPGSGGPPGGQAARHDMQQAGDDLAAYLGSCSADSYLTSIGHLASIPTVLAAGVACMLLGAGPLPPSPVQPPRFRFWIDEVLWSQVCCWVRGVERSQGEMLGSSSAQQQAHTWS